MYLKNNNKKKIKIKQKKKKKKNLGKSKEMKKTKEEIKFEIETDRYSSFAVFFDILGKLCITYRLYHFFLSFFDDISTHIELFLKYCF